MKKISVIGAGAWGTTLSILLAQKGHSVTLWAYEKELAAQMKERRENRVFLPGFQLSENMNITADAAKAGEADLYLFVVPSKFLATIAARFKKVIAKGAAVAVASKGIEENTLRLPLQILADELKAGDLAVLSGPNLSAEIARGMPAASVAASTDQAAARSLQECLMTERFRVYVNRDPLGVQLGGALKNVIAIAAGVADGLELGNNAKAALMIRGIAEITRLGTAMGADPMTFAGLSGMGDLITTCGSKLSRNHFVGEQLAKGRKLSQVLAGMQNVAEGVTTAQAALALGKKHGVELPLVNEVCQVLYLGKDPALSITDLMTRSATSE